MVGSGRLAQAAGGDAGIADLDEKPFGGIEEGLPGAGSDARRCWRLVRDGGLPI
jgi:hypothetical protein